MTEFFLAPLFDNDQELLAAEKDWQSTFHGGPDNSTDESTRNVAYGSIKKRIAELLSTKPITMLVVHDNECQIDKHDMKASLKSGLRRLRKHGIDSRLQPVFLGNFDIWTILVTRGDNKFIVADNDIWAADGETPAQVIMDEFERGGWPVVYGLVQKAKDGIKMLKDNQFFDTGD